MRPVAKVEEVRPWDAAAYRGTELSVRASSRAPPTAARQEAGFESWHFIPAVFCFHSLVPQRAILRRSALSIESSLSGSCHPVCLVDSRIFIEVCARMFCSSNNIASIAQMQLQRFTTRLGCCVILRAGLQALVSKKLRILAKSCFETTSASGSSAQHQPPRKFTRSAS